MALYLNSLSDQQLAILLKEGKPSAFTAIYERYWKQLFIVASKRLGNEDEAEEIIQEIFLNLWRKRETFSLTTTFSSYLAVAVKYEILDVMRKRAHISNYQQELEFTFTEADESTGKELDMSDLKNKLELTIKSLPEKCQIVFRLKHESGFSQKAIAEQLNISEKTVEAHLSKARKILRSEFGCLLAIVMYSYLR